jgi:Zn-dependent alcohol dehydrogenases
LRLRPAPESPGVSSAPNLDLVRSLGAEEVIDYTTKDILATGERFDIVADAVGALDFSRAQAILAEGGRYLAINGSVADMLARPRGSRRCIAGPAAERADDLAALVDLATAGRFRPLIDCILPFEAAVQAHARVDTGRKRAAWCCGWRSRGHRGIGTGPVTPLLRDTTTPDRVPGREDEATIRSREGGKSSFNSRQLTRQAWR